MTSGAAVGQPRRVRVAFTEAHGMAVEASQHPPPGVEYSFLKPTGPGSQLIRSPIKGYYGRYECRDCDLIEAIMTPIATTSPWVLSSADFIEVAAFSLLSAPVPRTIRL